MPGRILEEPPAAPPVGDRSRREGDILVVAAFEPELAPLRPWLGEALAGPLRGGSVVSAPVGVGLPQACVGSALRIAATRPSSVVLIGTCGAYPRASLRIGDVVVARRVLLVDPGEARGAGAFPAPMRIAVGVDAVMGAALAAAGAVPADVATTLSVTIDDEVAALVERVAGAQVEHLEAHGVATACEALGVPFSAVLGVANVVGSCGREQWSRHQAQAARAAADIVVGWIRSGAPRSARGGYGSA